MNCGLNGSEFLRGKAVCLPQIRSSIREGPRGSQRRGDKPQGDVQCSDPAQVDTRHRGRPTRADGGAFGVVECEMTCSDKPASTAATASRWSLALPFLARRWRPSPCPACSNSYPHPTTTAGPRGRNWRAILGLWHPARCHFGGKTGVNAISDNLEFVIAQFSGYFG